MAALVFASPFIIIGLVYFARCKPVRSVLFVLGTVSLIWMVYGMWITRDWDGDGLNSPLFGFLSFQIYVVPVIVVLALLFELIHRRGWRG